MAALAGALRTWAVKDKRLSETEISDLLTVVWVCSWLASTWILWKCAAKVPMVIILKHGPNPD